MFIKLQKLICLLLSSLLITLTASADTVSNQIIETSLTTNDSLEILKKISGSIGVGYESDFYEYNTSDKEQGLSLQLELFLKHNDWKYGLNSVVFKRLIKEEEAELGDTKIFISRPLDLFASDSSISSSISASLLIPTSQESKYEKEMYGNFTIGPALNWKRDNLNFFLIPRIGKIFNKYKTTFSGENNTSYYNKLSIASSYQISNKLSTQFTTSITQAWTDNNSRKSPTYASELNTDYQLAAQLSISLAVSIDDKIYKSDGTSSNIKIFDKNLSAYSVTLTREF